MSTPRDKTTPDPSSAARPTARRLPTRVTNACRRCRRNKIRCDSFRPCSLCLRADVDCEPAPLDETPSSSRRVRNARQGANPRRSNRQGNSSRGRSSTSASRTEQSPPQPHAQHNAVDIVPERLPVTNDAAARESETHSSYMPVDYGKSESAMGFARKISRLGTKAIASHSTSAIPDGECEAPTPSRRNGGARLPISTILGSRFPDHQSVLSLLEDYFDAVHWFSLVIYEPKFRQRLSSIQDGFAHPAETPFLSLLSMVLCMAAWYRAKRTSPDAAEEWRCWSDDLLKIVESRLVYVMDEHSIDAVQTCILLGSHHVYHGRPNLSFALLGATIKISHAMGLHRNPATGNPSDAEERKRVWWTIYTWDRFASISYGRPLSINDEDCNIEMPTDFPESPYFVQDAVEKELPGIVYSPYQTELSKLYLVASPALAAIFGCVSTPNSKQHFESTYALLVNEVTQRLIAWRQQLPPHLALDLDRDYDPSKGSWATRAHSLQSLSLQLTFDNLLIVLYRPFLARQVEHLSMKASSSNANASDSGSPFSQAQMPFLSPEATNLSAHDHVSPVSDATMTSEYWLRAAMRTARITETPQLAQLATDSHLVGFMALNLFHAAIVLILLALSDPLSDRVQEIKRTITRVFRLQELLGWRSTLSSQSSVVLQNLVYLLLQREGEAMFDPVKSATTGVVPHAQAQIHAQADPSRATVEDTLRLPLEAVHCTSDQGTDRHAWPNLGMAQRLNESLASIQRTITTSQDQPLPSADAAQFANDGFSAHAGAMPQPQQEVWQMLPGQSGSTQEPQPVPHDAQPADYGGNNLLWLWDFSWDGGSAR